MCEMTKELKVIAEQLIKKDHREISASMDIRDKIEFVNAVATLQEHSNYLQKTTLFEAA